MEEDKYIFKTNWFDSSAQLVREFYLTYYPRYGEVELYDSKNKRTFLKRTICATICEQDLYLHNTVNICSRKIYLVDYADNSTRMKLETKSERTIVLVGRNSLWAVGKLIDTAQASHLAISKLKIIQLNDICEQFLKTYAKSGSDLLSNFVNSHVILLELLGNNAVELIRNEIENLTTSDNGDDLVNFKFVYQSCAIPIISQSEDKAFASVNEYVPHTLNNCTCCIIKPHAVKEGLTGKIIMDIANSKFGVLTMSMFEFEYDQAKRLLAVYKEVLNEYPGMVTQLSQGPCIALCIGSANNGSNIVQTFREFVGPMDPDLARRLRPSTLRAKYGIDKIKNAVHCTDLPEDGCIELEYLFKTLLYTDGLTDV